MKKALVVEDDRLTATLIKRHLSFIGLDTEVKLDGKSGLECALTTSFDIIILDIVLPQLDGIKLCRKLRLKGLDTPVLMLTSRSSIEDIVKGMSTGADGYLAKPFSIKELQARSLALLRRPPSTKEEKVKIGDLELDITNKEFSVSGQRIPLRKREFAIMQMLTKHLGSNVSIERLNSATSEYLTTPTTNSVHVHISHLREKLSEVGLGDLIETIHGIGYRLNPPEA